jgi:GH25 family lysozyme M1 (1,4-beta-N-acetylmuramidase)
MEVHMDYVLGIDVYSLNSPDDTTNAGDPLKTDPITKKALVDPIKAAANWKAVYDAGVRFAYIKASEYHADGGFAERMQYAKNAGLLRGAYMLPHFELNNIADQVKVFVQTVGSDKGELPPMLDLESPGGNWPLGGALFKKIKDCLDRLTQAFGRKPIIYTSQSIVREYQIINPGAWRDFKDLKEYDIWVASYPYFDLANKLQYSDPNNPPKWSSAYPPQPDGYKPWIIWQWTEKGRLNGMGHENVDINSFKGTYADFLKWANATAPTPPPPDPDPNKPQPDPDKPQPPPQPNPTGDFVTYTVKPNDTLGGIALAHIRQYHINKNMYQLIDAIVAANPETITNRNIIHEGWVLKIPIT